MNNKAIYTISLLFRHSDIRDSCSKMYFTLQVYCKLTYEAKETGFFGINF